MFDADEFHDYVVAHGFGKPTCDAYKYAKGIFEKCGDDYSTIAHEVVARGMVSDSDK
ncbi:MAG: hypothetical protein V3T17_11225 [Pseudomonadales bacterium]